MHFALEASCARPLDESAGARMRRLQLQFVERSLSVQWQPQPLGSSRNATKW